MAKLRTFGFSVDSRFAFFYSFMGKLHGILACAAVSGGEVIRTAVLTGVVCFGSRCTVPPFAPGVARTAGLPSARSLSQQRPHPSLSPAVLLSQRLSLMSYGRRS
jgi:hypothetical protein